MRHKIIHQGLHLNFNACFYAFLFRFGFPLDLLPGLVHWHFDCLWLMCKCTKLVPIAYHTVIRCFWRTFWRDLSRIILGLTHEVFKCFHALFPGLVPSKSVYSSVVRNVGVKGIRALVIFASRIVPPPPTLCRFVRVVARTTINFVGVLSDLQK